MGEKFMNTAVKLARMYGVAETLNPIPYMDAGDFEKMINQWTKEYLLMECDDIVAFFENKILHIE